MTDKINIYKLMSLQKLLISINLILNINCGSMIGRLAHIIGRTKKHLPIKNVCGTLWHQPFSVVGHRTFGHKLQGD